MVTFEELFKVPVITDLISRIATPIPRMQRFFGMEAGGANVTDVGGRDFIWDIFDKTQVVATGRAPNASAASVTLQPVDQGGARCYRVFEKINIPDEKIYRTRSLGAPFGSLDARGQRYVMEQTRTLTQRSMNNREFMIARMLRGGFGLMVYGDDWYAVEMDQGMLNVDFKIPASNKGNLGGVLSGAWQTNTTDILGEILAVNALMQQTTGYALRHLWVNSVVYNHMLNNDSLRNVAGTANTVFTQFSPTGETSEEGIEDGGFNVVFRAVPWLQVHVTDQRLTIKKGGAGADKLDEVPANYTEDETAIFLPNVSSEWTELYNGSEIVRRNQLDQGSEEYGLTVYPTPTINPAGQDVFLLDNCLPVLKVPKNVYYGTVAA